ncbi:hypothetical protein CN071_08120, partial [Sinorhizobium meliloti]
MSPVLNLASRSAPLFSLLPLTLTLSPRAGRGDAVVFDRTRQRAHGISSPLPACGRAVRGKFMHSGRPFGLGWSGVLVGL